MQDASGQNGGREVIYREKIVLLSVEECVVAKLQGDK